MTNDSCRITVPAFFKDTIVTLCHEIIMNEDSREEKAGCLKTFMDQIDKDASNFIKFGKVSCLIGIAGLIQEIHNKRVSIATAWNSNHDSVEAITTKEKKFWEGIIGRLRRAKRMIIRKDAFCDLYPVVMGYDAWDVEEVDETAIEEENIDLCHEHEDLFKFQFDEVINNCRFHEAMSYIRPAIDEISRKSEKRPRTRKRTSPYFFIERESIEDMNAFIKQSFTDRDHYQNILLSLFQTSEEGQSTSQIKPIKDITEMMKGQNKWFDPKFCLKKIEQLLLNLYSIFKADVLESSGYLKSIGIGGNLGVVDNIVQVDEEPDKGGDGEDVRVSIQDRDEFPLSNNDDESMECMDGKQSTIENENKETGGESQAADEDNDDASRNSQESKEQSIPAVDESNDESDVSQDEQVSNRSSSRRKRSIAAIDESNDKSDGSQEGEDQETAAVDENISNRPSRKKRSIAAIDEENDESDSSQEGEDQKTATVNKELSIRSSYRKKSPTKRYSPSANESTRRSTREIVPTSFFLNESTSTSTNIQGGDKKNTRISEGRESESGKNKRRRSKVGTSNMRDMSDSDSGSESRSNEMNRDMSSSNAGKKSRALTNRVIIEDCGSEVSDQSNYLSVRATIDTPPPKRSYVIDSTKQFGTKRGKRKWTDEETNALIAGVRKYGLSKWVEIKAEFVEELSERTNVQLKDKWRVLQRQKARLQHAQGANLEEPDMEV